VIGILRGREDLPPGFLQWGTERRGSGYTVVTGTYEGVTRRWRSDGSCSTLGGLIGDTGRSFNFRTACRIHDLGYDLIRFFGVASWPGGGGNQRRAVDAQFGRDLSLDCSRRGFFTKYTCFGWADVYQSAVDANSVRQGYGIPK
jgi:hypothetical protein